MTKHVPAWAGIWAVALFVLVVSQLASPRFDWVELAVKTVLTAASSLWLVYVYVLATRWRERMDRHSRKRS